MASVERKGIRLIGVVFGCKSGSSRDRHLMGLFNSAFKKATPPKIILVNAPVSKPKFVKLGTPMAKPNNLSKIVSNLETPTTKPTLLSINDTQLVNNYKDWGIQVGTYSKKVNAHHIAIKARRIAPDLLKMLPAQLTPIYINQNMAWRVRFNSLDEKTARKTCLKLLSKNISCIAVPSEQILGYVVKK